MFKPLLSQSCLTNVLIIIVFTLFILYFVKWSRIENIKARKEKPNADSKTILFWNNFFGVEDYNFGFGKEPFFKFNCSVPNCLVTSDKRWIPVDQYDAIVFHGPEYNPTTESEFPSSRSIKQRYVYFSQESPSNRKVDDYLNHFFNWTMTYRLDSDISAYYFHVYDNSGKFVAPAENPQWKQPDFNHLKNYSDIYKRKKTPIAWFVSNCNSASGRENYVWSLQRFLHVDVYGRCGPFECPKSRMEHCMDVIKNDYYFYLSFENSLCQDYITEKVLNAVTNDAVPVVFGGANYDNYLPPHSYIDASKMTPQQLALTVENIIANETEYLKYFWWKRHYWFKDGFLSFCKLCEMLHDDSIGDKSYRIHEWWHGSEKRTVCKTNGWNYLNETYMYVN